MAINYRCFGLVKVVLIILITCQLTILGKEERRSKEYLKDFTLVRSVYTRINTEGFKQVDSLLFNNNCSTGLPDREGTFKFTEHSRVIEFTEREETKLGDGLSCSGKSFVNLNLPYKNNSSTRFPAREGTHKSEEHFNRDLVIFNSIYILLCVIWRVCRPSILSSKQIEFCEITVSGSLEREAQEVRSRIRQSINRTEETDRVTLAKSEKDQVLLSLFKKKEVCVIWVVCRHSDLSISSKEKDSCEITVTGSLEREAQEVRSRIRQSINRTEEKDSVTLPKLENGQVLISLPNKGEESENIPKTASGSCVLGYQNHTRLVCAWPLEDHKTKLLCDPLAIHPKYSSKKCKSEGSGNYLELSEVEEESTEARSVQCTQECDLEDYNLVVSSAKSIFDPNQEDHTLDPKELGEIAEEGEHSGEDIVSGFAQFFDLGVTRRVLPELPQLERSEDSVYLQNYLDTEEHLAVERILTEESGEDKGYFGNNHQDSHTIYSASAGSNPVSLLGILKKALWNSFPNCGSYFFHTFVEHCMVTYWKFCKIPKKYISKGAFLAKTQIVQQLKRRELPKNGPSVFLHLRYHQSLNLPTVQLCICQLLLEFLFLLLLTSVCVSTTTKLAGYHRSPVYVY